MSHVKHYFFAPSAGGHGVLAGSSPSSLCSLAGFSWSRVWRERDEHFNAGTDDLSVLPLTADFLSRCLSLPCLVLVPFLSDALK